mmetsp:Transcript_27154/g.67717  ORF Transcript_27154/g.67717 Transcript_27154/m.67717 type:complete len:320 (+) Transcript_27154:268-1227(+)
MLAMTLSLSPSHSLLQLLLLLPLHWASHGAVTHRSRLPRHLQRPLTLVRHDAAPALPYRQRVRAHRRVVGRPRPLTHVLHHTRGREGQRSRRAVFSGRWRLRLCVGADWGRWWGRGRRRRCECAVGDIDGVWRCCWWCGGCGVGCVGCVVGGSIIHHGHHHHLFVGPHVVPPVVLLLLLLDGQLLLLTLRQPILACPDFLNAVCVSACQAERAAALLPKLAQRCLVVVIGAPQFLLPVGKFAVEIMTHAVQPSFAEFGLPEVLQGVQLCRRVGVGAPLTPHTTPPQNVRTHLRLVELVHLGEPFSSGHPLVASMPSACQ